MGKSKEEVQKIRKEYKEKLNAILTPEQQEKYQTLRKERKERRKSQK
jgi:Spy/CpxP family protein refolding chaperone